MVELMTDEGGGRNRVFGMASSSSAANQILMPNRPAVPVPCYVEYPPSLAKYEDVVASPKLFMDTLENLHAAMGTKFMIPIIGGRDLDLHRLFVEVTSRGGIEKIMRERRWREVTAVFSFPSTATNASFVLRKYYMSLLHHYEQIYYFKAKGWIPSSADSLQSTPQVPLHPVQPMAGIQAAALQPQRTSASQYLSRATQVPPTGSPVMGVIDGKFDSGYLVTVTIGSEKLKGVLYQVPRIPVCQHPSLPLHHDVYAQNNYVTPAPPVLCRRRRRKKSEMKKRDPAHPKPNRSGYNFFFAEQHARLKPAYPGKDREISRMIGELWNKLTESEKAVYQDKAVKDKERYRIEMESYKERLKAGQIISCAVPLQQQPLELDASMAERSKKIETDGGDSQTHENEIGSGTSDISDSENYDDTADMDSDMETSPQVEVGGGNTDMDISIGKEGAQLLERIDNVGEERLENSPDVMVDTEIELAPMDAKVSSPCEGKERSSTELKNSVSREGNPALN